MPYYADPKKREAYNRKRRKARAAKAKAAKKRKSKKYILAKRNSDLRRSYGITHDDYLVMLESQQKKCAICETRKPGTGKKYFSVDHNHDTNAIRQLLCSACNTGLGQFRDNLELLRKAVAYLEQHEETE